MTSYQREADSHGTNIIIWPPWLAKMVICGRIFTSRVQNGRFARDKDHRHPLRLLQVIRDSQAELVPCIYGFRVVKCTVCLNTCLGGTSHSNQTSIPGNADCIELHCCIVNRPSNQSRKHLIDRFCRNFVQVVTSKPTDIIIFCEEYAIAELLSLVRTRRL